MGDEFYRKQGVPTRGDTPYRKGANVQLGPGMCLARVPRNGRNFEYLSGEDPFEQPAVSGGNTGIDWTGEQEWRHPGDIDLSLIPPDCGLVLVGQDTDVPAVADHSSWPIAVISRFRKDDTAIQ